jgi:agmatinase
VSGADPGVSLLGVGWDAKSSFLRGPAGGPAAIRRALHSEASNLTTEFGLDLGQPGLLADLGDVALCDCGGEDPDDESALARIREAAAAVLRRGSKPLVLGGDHAVAYPLIQAAAEFHPGLTVLQFDAHPDLYQDFEGDRLSHACPFARVMEEGLAVRLVQVGVRSLPPALRTQAQRLGVEMLEMRGLGGDGWGAALQTVANLPGPLYISFDLDALDPGCAPGVSHHEPGGLDTRQALELLHAVAAPVVAADVVELNPARDWQEMTAAVAAKLVKEIAGLMLRR